MEQKGVKGLSMRISFLHLPAELRLKIYEDALISPNEYMDRPMIVIHDRGNVSTSRSRFRAMSICPSWEGNDGTARKLLGLNHQIRHEAEALLYSKHTLFFRNSFDLDRLGVFLDTLSATARHQVRSVGFEVCFFVHAEANVPKRTRKEYERAGTLLAEKLSRWESVVFYLDPRFYYSSTGAEGRKAAGRGVLALATRFATLCKHITFSPLPAEDHHILNEVRQVVWQRKLPKRSVLGECQQLVKHSSSQHEEWHGTTELPNN